MGSGRKRSKKVRNINVRERPFTSLFHIGQEKGERTRDQQAAARRRRGSQEAQPQAAAHVRECSLCSSCIVSQLAPFPSRPQLAGDGRRASLKVASARRSSTVVAGLDHGTATTRALPPLLCLCLGVSAPVMSRCSFSLLLRCVCFRLCGCCCCCCLLRPPARRHTAAHHG